MPEGLKRGFLIILAVVLFSTAKGNDSSIGIYDTLRLISGSKVILPGGYRIKIDKDTTLVIHGGIPYKVKYPRGEAGDIFFDSLEFKADRNRWASQLHDIVITAPPTQDLTDTMQTSVSADPFISQGGKFIRSIRTMVLEPFGPNINDTTLKATLRIERFGNDMHRVTQTRVMKNHLLFREGELVDPNEFADNERILRSLPFIEDARIRIREIPGSDSVDILVIAKDNFSIGVSGAVDDIDAGNLSVFERNLFGLGHELRLNFYWDGERSPWLGNELIYIVRNLGGSFIDSRLRFAQIYDSETYQFGLERSFFTPDIKWAGAMELERTRARRFIDSEDSLGFVAGVKYNTYDLWVGRSFFLSSNLRQTRNRLNFVIASRIFRNHYIDRPDDVSETKYYPFHNRNVWLTSLSVSSQSYFRSNLILDFGRTEDIPQGMLFTMTAGPEINEFNTRFYTGFSFSQGRYLGNFGYLYTRFEGGGFLKDYSYIEQGVINADLDYFTPLFIFNRFKFRHFASANFVKGIRRFEDEFIRINDFESIRGFRSALPAGQQKISLNYEVSAFSPYYLYGFRFVLFGFADAAMVGPEWKKWHDGEFFSGFGVGVRIRNERLVFPTITFRLGYYPNHPQKSFPLFFDVYGEQRLNPQNFYVSKPDIINFE